VVEGGYTGERLSKAPELGSQLECPLKTPRSLARSLAHSLAHSIDSVCCPQRVTRTHIYTPASKVSAVV